MGVMARGRYGRYGRHWSETAASPLGSCWEGQKAVLGMRAARSLMFYEDLRSVTISGGRKYRVILPQRCAKENWPVGPVTRRGWQRAGPEARPKLFIGTLRLPRNFEIFAVAQK